MPYIGTQPLTGQFKKLDAISVVNGQAAYTLNYNSAAYKPATANALLVSVNGVIQAAGDAFNISGSTITFTENLVTGDVIDFIIALGDTGSAVTPVDGSVTTAKLGDDSVTKAKIATTELDLATIKDSSGTNTAMTIDSTGRILTPARPAFRARNDATSSATSVTGIIVFNVEDFDIGGNYDTSNGRFTAPVAGIYYFCFDALVTDASNNVALASGNSTRVSFFKNGSEFVGSQRAYNRTDGATQYNTIYRTDLIQLAVNDYIQVNVGGQYIYRDLTGYYDPVFQGHLVG